MGCGLKKLKPVSEENSPGKIYSTLKRPQVETKVGTAYSYRYLDFLIGKDGGTSTLRLSSVRELPDQLQELYLQGYVLAALHPFIQPCGPGSDSPQHQLYRAILVRNTDGGERGQSMGPHHRLQLEDCLSAEQEPTAELIQGYVKKQIQDAADQGVLFVGFIQEPYGAPCRREPETPSLSLHSSPSSVLGSLCSSGPHEAPGSPPDPPSSPRERPGGGEESAPCESEESSPCHNNNSAAGTETKDRPYRQRRSNGVELLALYNHPPMREAQVKYYTLKVPLRVHSGEDGVRAVEAHWLDHMTQHFTSGASLVDGYFHLGHPNDEVSRSVESVFIFQEPTEGEAHHQAFDAIVVEQWTVIHGLQVKADYIPLLQSLASFGWRLTCVLPTPVLRTNSDGSLSTKQIVFLQRPVLSRKKRDSKKLIFKARSKSNKNCIKDTSKNKKKSKNKELEDAKSMDQRQNDAKVEEREEPPEDVTTECNTNNEEEEEEEEEEEKKMEASLETVKTLKSSSKAEGSGAVAEQTETKEEPCGDGDAEVVLENGLETDPEEETLTTPNDIVTKEVTGQGTSINQSAAETQE